MAKTKAKAKKRAPSSRELAEGFQAKFEDHMESKIFKPGTLIDGPGLFDGEPIPLRLALSQRLLNNVLEAWNSLNDLNYLVGSQKKKDPLDPLIERQYNLLVQHFDLLLGNYQDQRQTRLPKEIAPIANELLNAIQYLWDGIVGIFTLDDILSSISIAVGIGVKITDTTISFGSLEGCRNDIRIAKMHFPNLYSRIPLTIEYVNSEMERRKSERKMNAPTVGTRERISIRLLRYGK